MRRQKPSIILLMGIYCLLFTWVQENTIQHVQAINSRLQIATSHTSNTNAPFADMEPNPQSGLEMYRKFRGIKARKIEFTPESPTGEGGMESWKICLIILGVVVGLCLIACLWFCFWVACPQFRQGHSGLGRGAGGRSF